MGASRLQNAASPLPSCPHCGVAVDVDGAFCCLGCAAAAALLRHQDLNACRAWADEPMPRGGVPTQRAFLSQVLAQRAKGAAVVVDVQGITCGACVWVLEELGRRHGLDAVVNPGIGRLTVHVDDVVDGAGALGAPAALGIADTLGHYLDDVETLGYRLGPPAKEGDGQRDTLVLKTGLTTAFAMVSMSLSFSRYFGLDGGPLADLFLVGEVLLAALAVAVGGSTFIASAWRSLRLGLLSFDAPIALGIIAAFAGSVANLILGSEEGLFFDAVTTFIALMVGGRLVQRSLLQRSRSQLLKDTGLLTLPVTVLDEGVPITTTAGALAVGSRLLLRPGDILPASSTSSTDVVVSLAWITGEVEARSIAAGAAIPAGASLADGRSVVVTVQEAAVDSELATQLGGLGRTSDSGDDDGTTWRLYATISISLVVFAALVAGVAWTVAVDLPRGLSVATAVLVVTCPCAIGLALPLVDELAHRDLRRLGVFVRRGGFFARLQRIRRVVLDKTGTVTLGTLTLDPAARDAIRALNDADAQRLFQVASRSSHPKSQAVVAALVARGASCALDETLLVTEHLGVGIEAVVDGQQVGLMSSSSQKGTQGAPMSDADVDNACTVLTIGGLRFELRFTETLQRDARDEIAALRARGLQVVLASGDHREKVAAVAESLEVSAWHHSLKPGAKARLVEDLGADTVLFVGDGINDAMAFDAAGVAGTPALDHPQLPARADFYVMRRGLGPLNAIFAIGHRHQAATGAALVFAVAYNAVVVPAALAGWLTPQWCALLMPVSSIAVVLLVQQVFARSVRAGSKVNAMTNIIDVSPLSAAKGGAL